MRDVTRSHLHRYIGNTSAPGIESASDKRLLCDVTRSQLHRCENYTGTKNLTALREMGVA
jgi:hypothetical protein